MVEPGAYQQTIISTEEAAVIAREVRRLIREGDERSAWEQLRHLHPADMGSIMAALPRTSREAIVAVMSPDAVAWMFRHMNPVQAARVSARLGTGILSLALAQVNPRTALDILRRMPGSRAREVAEAIGQPADDPAVETTPLDTAAGFMVTRFPTVHPDERVESARVNLRRLSREDHNFTHVFVIDDDSQLIGQVAMIDLAMSADDAPITELIMPSMAPVPAETPREECARLQRHYNLTQLPVVEGGRLIGVIPSTFLLSASVAQDTEQILQVANVAGDSPDGPLLGSIRTRLPWLTINLATTFLAAFTVSLFESTLARVVVLAAFLPVVAGQGGIGGTQTLTLIIRAMALGELVGMRARRLLTRELILGLIHGVWLGVLVAVIAALWKQNLGLALVLGVAMLGNMAMAGVTGAGVPLLLRRIGVDPAVASAVVVTTVTDVCGFLLFLGIASAAITLIV
ncbi:MAG: magnesium transporter [Chloroflexota bacterium]|nr:magnesium transporter [Chloroflexota bacterium]MDE2685817.1 magnesium transporter [Chloroflexota bacterium]